MAVCGIKYVSLKANTKILGIHFLYNNKLNMEKNFLTAISNTQNVFKIWRMRNLTLEGRILFNTLALSKIVHLCLASVLPKQVIKEIENIQKNFLWNRSTPKIQQSTLRNSFAADGLRNVDIYTKTASLKCTWVKRL